MKKITFLFLLVSFYSYCQIGVGTTTPNSTLDIVARNPTGTSTTVDGILIPRVDRQRAQSMTGLTTSTMIYVNSIATGTATGTAVNITSIGFYFFDGTVWQRVATGNNTNWALAGNLGTNGGTTVLAGTNFIGTTDNQNIDFRTNNLFRGRFSNLGEFFVGTLNTSLPGDLMNGVGNATFPWAINGYTSFAAGGVYGLRQLGSTGIWGAVQGELDATLPAASRGVAGSGSSNSHYGVYGFKPTGGSGFGGIFLNDLGYTGGFFNLSDERLKKNIKPLFNGIDKVKLLNFYTYNFKTDEYDVLGGDELHYGVMANELEKILPSLVKSKIIDAGKIRSISEEKQPKSIPFEIKAVNYLELIPIAIQAIKEQQTIIENQNERIEKLEKLVNSLLKK